MKQIPSVFLVWIAIAPAAAAITLISVEQEIAIGRQANAEVRRETPAITDAQVTSYVRGLVRRIVAVAPGPKYPYSVAVADYREINAFALPGGPIWINRGVLHAATAEAQVAGVLAHEIAHVAQRHAADLVTKGQIANFGLGVLGALLGNSGGAQAAQVAASLGANVAFLRFSRDHEREADRVGLQMLTRAGWDGRGMVELFALLRKEQDRDPDAVEAFFSSHPPPRDRIAALQADVSKRTGGRRDSPQFQEVRARLLKMRAPQRMSAGRS